MGAERTPPLSAPPPSAVVFADPLLRRGLVTVVLAIATVVAGVAAAAFFLSFEAIRAFAKHSGGIAPQHAWLAPLLVDSFIFVASAADLWFAATGTTSAAAGAWQRLVAALPKLLLAVAAGGSFALNVAHAPAHLGARVIAALPPAALVLTFEILLVIVRRAVAARLTRLSVQHATAASAQPLGTLTHATVAGPHTPTTPPPAARPAASGGRRGQAAAVRLAAVRALYLDGVTVGQEIARRLDLPPSTTRRLLTAVKRDLASTQHPPGPGSERSATEPAPERDGRPPGRALVTLTRTTGGERP
jgi:hypothetical protein